MKVQKELYVVAAFQENRLFIWKSKLFGNKKEAGIVRVNLPEKENWKVMRAIISFPDLKGVK